jgi:murein L,D-transpeptidase YafK
MRVLILGVIASAMLLFDESPAQADGGVRLADSIVVYKSKRRMILLRDNAVIGEYKIALGLDPVGGKEREGDFRTPEGSYRLIRRNTNSDFFLSIEVSYPNDEDRARARRLGKPPGGSIMIHGLPNRLRHPPDYYEKRDWTDGCIAVSNADILEIFLLTELNTPIEILP